jgi:uncharacterized membrane protein
MTKPTKSKACQVCGTEHHAAGLRPAILVRPALSELILRETGHWSVDGWICVEDLQKFSGLYVQELLREEKGELSTLEEEVVTSLHQHEILSSNPEEELQSGLTIGQRLADRMATLAGSWTFIMLFGGVMVVWITINTMALFIQPFDPYPFILLNLALSCLAAIQAPVIMMSQGRQETRDRLHAMRDYQVNLKAELEIRHLHQKIDHLLSHQWQRLVEIQEVQMELMAELRSRK